MAALVTFACGVVAATAGAGVAVRIVCSGVFLSGTYLLLDAVVMAASWRLTGGGLKIPTLASRHREIGGGPDLIVTPAGNWTGAIVITGRQGTRTLRANPLVSPADLRAWWTSIADEEPPAQRCD